MSQEAALILLGGILLLCLGGVVEIPVCCQEQMLKLDFITVIAGAVEFQILLLTIHI